MLLSFCSMDFSPPSCPVMTSFVFLSLFVFPISSQLSKRYLAFIHCTILQQCTFIFGFRPSTIPPSSSFLSCIHMYALSVLPLHPVLPHPILSRTSTLLPLYFPPPNFVTHILVRHYDISVSDTKLSLTTIPIFFLYMYCTLISFCQGWVAYSFPS